MRRPLLIIATAALGSCATPPTQAEIRAAVGGPAPERAAGTAMIESAIRDKLKDPESARFEWPNGFVSGWYQRPFGKRYYGWITCGTVNAKNSYGGYTGKAAAIGVINDGAVVESNIDEASARYGGFVAEACRKIGVPVG